MFEHTITKLKKDFENLKNSRPYQGHILMLIYAGFCIVGTCAFSMININIAFTFFIGAWWFRWIADSIEMEQFFKKMGVKDLWKEDYVSKDRGDEL